LPSVKSPYSDFLCNNPQDMQISRQIRKQNKGETMSFTKKFMNAAGATALLAASTLGGTNALAQESQMPPPTRQQIFRTCEKLTDAINTIPGFTALFAGHPSLIYKPDNLRKAAENMCPSIKNIWKQPKPAHQWIRPDTRTALKTEKDLAPAFVSAVQQFHNIIHEDAAINMLVHGSNEAHQDFHFAMALAEKMVATYTDIFPRQPR
jgi:hypothetical protein